MLDVLDLTYDAKCDVYFHYYCVDLILGLFCDVNKVDKIMHDIF
jgi:hypothetical protein